MKKEGGSIAHILTPYFCFSLIIFFFVGSFFGSASHADVTPTAVNCTSLFQANKGLWQKTKSYGQEVVMTRGRRLILKPVDETPGSTRWLGLLSQQILTHDQPGFRSYWSRLFNFVPKKIGNILAGDDRFHFTPFTGIYNITMRRPVGFLTRRIFGTQYEPAFFFKFPVTIALSIGIFLGVDAAYQSKLQNHIQLEITTHAVEYNQAIQSDYRYNNLRVAVEKGELTLEDAQREAYLISLAYSQYFQHLGSQSGKPTLDSEMTLIDHYLFSHLKPVIENGVVDADGYIVPTESKGPLSESQIMSLFQNSHLRYLKYQIIIEKIQDSELYQKMKLDSEFSEIIRSIEDDPFSKTLIGLFEQNQITSAQLQRYLQEDTYWQNRFQDWTTLGVTRLQSEDNQFSDQPLTIDIVRDEILAEISLQTSQ